jgi:hypothetical protein
MGHLAVQALKHHSLIGRGLSIENSVVLLFVDSNVL